MTKPEKCLKIWLRLIGGLAVFALIAVVMPHAWLVYFVNLAEPDTPIRLLIPYLARVLSAFYGLLGLLLLLFSTDLDRYAVPLRLYAVWSIAVATLLMVYLRFTIPPEDRTAFLSFIMTDATVGIIAGLGILLLQHLIRTARPKH